jgi:hypothetical protein
MAFFKLTEGSRTVADFRVNGQPVASFAEVEYPPPMVVTRLRPRSLNPTILAGPKLKLARARKHIEETANLWREYGDSKPFRDGQRIGSDGIEVVWVSIAHPPPVQISIAAGDAIHNLRSALDWLACELVRENGKTPTQNTGFPTSDAALKSLESLISPSAASLLKRVRRQKRWNEALWALHQLDIQDKHDQILTTAAATLNVETTVGMPMLGITQAGELTIGAIPPGARPFPGSRGRRRGLPSVVLMPGTEHEVYRFTPNICEHVEFGADLVFAGGLVEGEPVINMLELFTHGVERMLTAAERRLFR